MSSIPTEVPKKKKPRCLGKCGKRIKGGLTFTCRGCQKAPLCLTCVGPSGHDCGYDWAEDHREKLRKENERVAGSTLADRV